jgi:hypothetical protein
LTVDLNSDFWNLRNSLKNEVDVLKRANPSDPRINTLKSEIATIERLWKQAEQMLGADIHGR